MYTGEIIDCDVHHARGSDVNSSPTYRRAGANMSRTAVRPASFPHGSGWAAESGHGFMRADTYPADGAAPGSDYDLLRRQVLERSNVRRAILTFGDDSHILRGTTIPILQPNSHGR